MKQMKRRSDCDCCVNSCGDGSCHSTVCGYQLTSFKRSLLQFSAMPFQQDILELVCLDTRIPGHLARPQVPFMPTRLLCKVPQHILRCKGNADNSCTGTGSNNNLSPFQGHLCTLAPAPDVAQSKRPPIPLLCNARHRPNLCRAICANRQSVLSCSFVKLLLESERVPSNNV